MTAGHAAPQVIIIHAGQVVMDQGISVDQLNGGGDTIQIGFTDVQCATGCINKHGPYTFTTSTSRIVHGLDQHGGGRRVLGNEAGQKALETGLPLPDPGADISHRARKPWLNPHHRFG